MVFAERKKLFHWRTVRRNKKEYSVCKQVIVATAVGLAAPTVSHAGPTGGEVVSGSGTINQSGNTTDILQATHRLDINWQTFSTNVDETVNFFQPNEIAIAINRVLGGVPSSLAGTLNANGQVWIINQAGIVFHQSSVVNVAGLLATTLNDIDENNDEWKFLGSGYGSVLNYGEINISDGGFAIMAAPHVANAGVVKADLGQIHLAGTNTFTMDLRGDGLITFSVPDDAVQEIEADGQALGVDNAGTLQARSGTVTMTARTASDLVTGAMNLSGVVDATAFSTGKDGGSVELVSAGDINFDDGASIKVDGGIDGDGGDVVTWAEGVNRFKNGAEISARGGDESGDGGFIELSGNTVKVRGDIDASAPHGEAGTFLLDPDRIIIAAGTGTSSFAAATGSDGSTGTGIAGTGSTGSTTVFEEDIEAIAGGGTRIILEADDLIYVKDLGTGGTALPALNDGFLDVGSGGISLRILDDTDSSAQIVFQNKNNTIRSTGGDVLIEVNGTNASGVYAGPEIDIGNITVLNVSSSAAFTGAAVHSANVTLRASSGAVYAGNITVNAIINDPTLAPFNVVDTDANLTITAGTDIVINGDINVAADYKDDTALFQIFDIDANVNIAAGSNLTISGDFNVSANAFNGTSAQIGTGDADITANVTAGDDITITGDVSAYVDVQTVGGIGQAHSAMINVNMIAGANTAGTAATNSGTMTISGNVNAYGHVFVANPGARAVTSASVNLAAGNDINILGTTDTDGLAGIQVSALAENGNAPADSPGRVDVDAYLTMVAGAAGSSGSINIDANVDVLAQGTMDGAFRAPAFADAYANLTAADDILIDNNLRVQALTDLTQLDTGTTGGFGSAHATLLASAGTVAGTAASSADTGGIVVGGLTEVIASNQKNIGVGTPLAVAYADLDAGDDISLNSGIHVYALNTVTTASFNANDFNGATATATLDIQAGNGGDADPVGRIDINDGVVVLANNQIYGTAASTVNVIADAYATINAPAAVDIGGSSNYGGITVQALANNQITGSGSHTAKAYADLDIAVGSGDIYGPVLVSASANINSGSGGFASAVANASHTDQGDITIHDYGITVSAVSNIGSGAANAGGFASANLNLLAGSTATGNVVVEGDVFVEADVDNNASGGTDADAYATLSIYAGGSAASTNGSIQIDGDVQTIAYASAPNLLATSVTINASANANLYAANDIDINGGTNTADTALYVTADAFLGGSASVGIASANANLTVSAGNYVGTSVSGSVDIDGGVLVSADATASSALAGVLYANARAYAYLDAYNDLDIDGDFIVAGSANLPSNNIAGSAYAYGRAIANLYVGSDAYFGDTVTVQAVANNSAFASNSGGIPDAVALAYLNVDAGVGSGIIGYININGDLNVTADATLDNNSGFSNAAIAVAYGDLESRREDINITGDVTVMANAQQLAALGSTAVAYAELDMEAGFNAMNSYNLNVGGDVSVMATANNASVDSVGGAANAQAYANLQAAGDVYIAGGTNTADTAIKVTADADAFGLFAGTSNTAYAYANARLFVDAGNNGSSGNVDIDGGVLVNADARVDGGPLAIPLGYAGAFGIADRVEISAYNDIDISGPLTVSGNATITSNVGSNGSLGLIGKGAIGYADVELYAGNNIDIGSDVSVTAYAHNYGALSTAINFAGYAYGLAYLDIFAGTNGPGNLTINGNTLVSADADFTGTYASTAGSQRNFGYTYVGAVADADLGAYNDITLNGDLNVFAFADGEVFANPPPSPSGFYGFASASANLEINAGLGSPSGASASSIGYGDFLATGDVAVDAEATINRGYSLGFVSLAYGLSSVDIDAYRDLSIYGSLSVEGEATLSSSMVGLNAIAAGLVNVDLDAGRDVYIGNDLNVYAGASNNAFAYNFIPGLPPDAVALAYLNVDAGTGGAGSTGAIYIDGNLNVTADATLTNNIGFGNAAIAVAYGDLESRRDDITITGDASVMANAQQLAARGSTAIAYAELDINAGFGSSGSYDLTIGGDVSVMATANNASVYVSSGRAGANATAYAYLGAAGDVYVAGGTSTADTAIKVTADADAFAVFAGTNNTAYAYANAALFVSAGNNGSSGNVDIDGGVLVSGDAFTDGGPFAAPYGYAGAFGLADVEISAYDDINISGPVTVAGSATITPSMGFNPGFPYLGLVAKGAIGYADAEIYAGNNVYIGDDLTVTGYAHNYGALSTAINYGGYAYALAYLDVAAGTDGTGSITVNGNTLVSADAEFTGTSANLLGFIPANFGFTYVGGVANAYFEAANDVTLNGDIDVLGNADAGIYVNYGFYGQNFAYARLGIDAGTGSPSTAAPNGAGDFTVTGHVNVNADANLNSGAGSYLAYAGDDPAAAFAYAYLNIDAYQDINIGDTLTVNADAFVDNVPYVYYGGAYAYAYAFLEAGRNIDIDNDITINATAVSYAGYASNDQGYGGFAAAEAYLDMVAGDNGTGSIDIDTVTNGLTVSATGFAPYAVSLNADVEAEAYLEAANSIDILGDVTVTANAHGSAIYVGQDVDATADAYLGIEAGTNGPGSLTITGNTLVSADAYLGGAYGGTANAEAYAYAYLIANNDITLTGNLSVIAYAEGNNFEESNFAYAGLRIDAGTGSPSAASGAINGYGDFTLTGNLLVDADARAVPNSYGVIDPAYNAFSSGVAAYAYLKIDAYQDINIGGTLNVSADAFIDNIMYASAGAYAYAYAYLDAGRNVGIDNDISVTATVQNYGGFASSANNVFAGFGDAKAYLGIAAGTQGTGSIDIDTVTNGLTVSAITEIPYAIEGNAGAFTRADFQAANDIDVLGDITISALTDASAASDGTDVDADARSYLNMQAGTSGPGSLTITGNTRVSAVGYLGGINYGGTANVYGYAFANLEAANDITVTGDLSVVGYAFGTNIQESNAGYAYLYIAAGTASPSGATASTYGYGDFTMTGNLLVDATAINDGGTSGSSVNAYTLLDIEAFRDISLDGTLTVDATALITSNNTNSAGNVSAYAEAYLDAGRNISITGNVAVTALASNNESVATDTAPEAHAYAYLRAEAGTQGTGFIDIDSNVLVDATAFIGSNAGSYGTARAHAYGYLTAHSGDIDIDGNIDVTALAQNIASTASYQTATAELYMNAGINGSSGAGYDLTVGGDLNVTATATADNVGDGYMEAYAYARLRAGNDINLSYTSVNPYAINVTANAQNNGIPGSSASDVYARSVLDIEAGISSAGDVDIYGAINVTADAYAQNATSTATAVAISDVDITAGRDISIEGNVYVLADAVTDAGSYAKASADLLVAAGTHSSGSLYMDFSSIDVSANAYAGDGRVDVDVSAYFSAADDLALYGNFLTVTAPVSGSDDIVADAYLYLYAGGHNSNGNLYVGIDHILVSADADATSGYAHAYATASFNAADDVTIFGDDLRVLATAYSGGGNNAYATAELYMAAGLHSSGDLAVYQNYITVSAEVTYAGSTALANAYAGLTAAENVGVYINDYLDVSAYAYAPNFHPADAYATLYMAAGTHGSPGGNLYVDVTNNLNVQATAFSATSDATADAEAVFTAYNDITINTPSLTVMANAYSSDSFAYAGAYLDAYAGNKGSGDLLIDVDTATVAAYASNDTSDDAYAYAAVDLKAANNITVFASNVDVYAGAYNGSSGDAVATARFDAYAGYLTSTGDLYMDITTTEVTAYAYVDDDADADAYAYMDLTAANDITLYGDTLTVLADAYVGSSESVHAGAYLSAYAGNKGSGDLYMDITTTRVAAYATNSDSPDAYAYAYVDLKAANDITLYGSSFDVYAGAYDHNSGDAVANARFNAYAGYLTSTGDLYMDITTTKVTAYAYVDSSNEAFAYAYMDLTAANNITFYGDSLTVLADAYAGESTAQAGAYLTAYAGNKGTGDLYMDINTTRVAAYASNDTSDDAYANAYVDLKAANDITVYGSNFNVYAGAYNGSSGDAHAYAGFEAYAGYMTGTGDLYLDINTTEVVAYAYVEDDNTALANAYMGLRAAEDITVYGSSLSVLADAVSDDDSYAIAYASLYMAAGTGSTGSLYMDVTDTLISANAYVDRDANPYAYAEATFTAANDVTIYGDTLTIYAGARADTSGNDVYAGARLNMAAGTHSNSGDLYVDINTTLVSADANGSTGNVDAYVYASMSAFNNVTLYGSSLSVLGEADSDTNDADANVTLHVEAGTGGTGDLYMDIDTVLVSADADVDTDDTAEAFATVILRSANDVTIYGDTLTVRGRANVDNDADGDSAEADADLAIYAGTAGTGSILIDNSTTLVSAEADANSDANDGVYADARVYMSAADNISIFGQNLTVVANADLDDSDGSAFATAELNIHAGTGSSGDLYVDVTNVTVSADAHGDSYASAFAYAGLTAATDITVLGNDFSVLGYATADIANADAELLMYAGLHSDGSMYIDNASNMYVIAGAFGNSDATANANATFYAADNLEFNGNNLAVVAYGFASESTGNADVSATLTMAAGTHGSDSGYLLANINQTEVLAYAFVYNGMGSALADAHADIYAGGDLSFYGSELTVQAQAANYASTSAYADASATLTMAAGTHGSTGDLYVGIDSASVLAYAETGPLFGPGPLFNRAYADAHATFTAANDISMYGNDLTVYAGAENFATPGTTVRGIADASATLFMYAGSHSNGSLTVDLSSAKVQAFAADAIHVISGGSAFADAHATILAADDLTFNANDLNVSAYGLHFDIMGLSDVNASLIMAAGTHGSDSGSLFTDIGTTRVEAYAGGYHLIGAAFADAYAGFYAGGDATLDGGDIIVKAGANSIGSSNYASANARLYMAAGTHASSGDLNVNVSSVQVSADASTNGGVGTANAYGLAYLTAHDDININGTDIQTTANGDASAGVGYALALQGFFAGNDINFSGNATASANVNGVFGTNSALAAQVFRASNDINFTGAAVASADATASGSGNAYGLAFQGFFASNDIVINGGIVASADVGAFGSGRATGSAIQLFSASNNIDFNGSATASATATASSATGFAYAGQRFAASNDIDISGELNLRANAIGISSAIGSARNLLLAGNDIDVNGDVNVLATADNPGPTGNGGAYAFALHSALASGSINMDGVSVSADASCFGNTGTCNPTANAVGFFASPNDISLSGPINVNALAVAANTGTTANAVADLDILASGDITVGNVSAVGSAIISHSGVSALAVASGNANIQAGSSVTLNGNVTASGNASNTGSMGSASGSAFVTIGAAGGDILINGGILANVGLTSPGGTAGYALGSLQAAGSNIAGPGFQTPTATAGGASVTNIMTDTETVANSTATLIINPTIVTGDNELTRRIALTWLEATGRVLPTSLELFNGTAVIQTGTPIQTFYNLPNGNGQGGFTVDENGNLIFRPSINGLPVGLPFPYQLYELCSGEKKVVNCPWEDEPLFY